MRLSNLVRFVEDKSIAAAAATASAAKAFSQDVKVEYQTRQLQRAVERIEIQARALEMYEARVASKAFADAVDEVCAEGAALRAKEQSA